MELVAFISCELDEPDMIVSFAVHPSEDSVEVESLTLMRTPKYEIVLDEWERGASVSFEREEDEDDEIVLLREVRYVAAEKIVTVVSDRHVYELDVRTVAPDELNEMCRVLRKMNFDSSLKLEGI